VYCVTDSFNSLFQDSALCLSQPVKGLSEDNMVYRPSNNYRGRGGNRPGNSNRGRGGSNHPGGGRSGQTKDRNRPYGNNDRTARQNTNGGMNRTDDRAHTGRHDNYRQRDHRNRQNDDHRDRNTTDVRELARTIASLQAKLDSLQPGRNAVATTNKPTSANPDFADISKTIYKWAQLQHHLNNWKTLPKSLGARIDRLTDDIKPPNANDQLRSQLKTLSTAFGKNVCDLVNRHLQDQLIETEQQAGLLDPTDLPRAKEIANKYLRTRLGRLQSDKRESLVESAADMVGIHRQQQMKPMANDNRQSKPTTANNNGDQPLPPTEVWRQVHGTPHTRKRRASWTPNAAASTSNRFDLLDVEDDASDRDMDEGDAEGEHDAVPSQPMSQQPSHKKNRPTPIMPRTLAGVGVTVGNHDRWSFDVRPDTECIVVGDSNLRSIKRIPPHWQVESLGGARFRHVAGVIGRIRPPANRHVNIVTLAGINHRSDRQTDIIADIDHMIHEARGNDAINRVFCAGISAPATLPEARNVRYINRCLIDAAGSDNYILPLDPSQVNINPQDTFGIHHTSETADRIMAVIYRHVEGKDF
jgi:hypothetical protein